MTNMPTTSQYSGNTFHTMIEDDMVNIEIMPAVAFKEGNEVSAVNARDLHAELGVGDHFSAWIKRRLDDCFLTEGVDFLSFSERPNNPKGGRPRQEYWVTLDAAKHLCMMEKTARGKLIRCYFIEYEKQTRKALAGTGLDAQIARAVENALAPLLQHMQGLAQTNMELTDKATTFDCIMAKNEDSIVRLGRKYYGVNLTAFRNRLITLGYLRMEDGIIYVKAPYRDVYFSEKYSTENGYPIIVATKQGIELLTRLYKSGQLPMRKDFEDAWMDHNPEEEN